MASSQGKTFFGPAKKSYVVKITVAKKHIDKTWSLELLDMKDSGRRNNRS